MSRSFISFVAIAVMMAIMSHQQVNASPISELLKRELLRDPEGLLDLMEKLDESDQRADVAASGSDRHMAADGEIANLIQEEINNDNEDEEDDDDGAEVYPVDSHSYLVVLPTHRQQAARRRLNTSFLRLGVEKALLKRQAHSNRQPQKASKPSSSSSIGKRSFTLNDLFKA